jgi:hypothetical protein
VLSATRLLNCCSPQHATDTKLITHALSATKLAPSKALSQLMADRCSIRGMGPDSLLLPFAVSTIYHSCNPLCVLLAILRSHL